MNLSDILAAFHIVYENRFKNKYSNIIRGEVDMMCCYYPTTTVAIDDDPNFLGILAQHSGIANCIPYSHPESAIEALCNQKPLDRLFNRIIKTTHKSDVSDMVSDNHSVHFNIRRLHEEIYNKERFNDVSVLIIDYYMDNMDGIEVCELLKDHPAKKILLTGGADKEKIAIEAFNNGIIHRFINKSDPHFSSKLRQAINVLKDAYFRELSLRLFPHIPASSINILQNSAYINFINNQLAQFNSTEFYLLDSTGSMLFLNTEGTPVWLIVKSSTEINQYKIIATDQDANEELVQALATRKLMPFFFTDEDYDHPASKWDTFLYAAHQLPGIADHYYAYTEGHIRNNLIREKIVSYYTYQTK